MYSKLRKFFRRFEEYVTLILSAFINLLRYGKNDLASEDTHSVIIIKLDHIGDVLLSIPSIASLREHFPKAYIGMVVNSSSRSAAELIPYLDEVFCYNARFFSRIGRERMFDIAKGLRFIREMRRRNFDLIVDLRGSFASSFYALFAGSKYRLDRGTYLIQRKLGRIPDSSEHEAEVNLNILARTGIDNRPQIGGLNLSQEDINVADSIMREFCNSDVNPYTVIIHSGGPSLLKRWPAEMYTQLINLMLKEYNVRFILIGGKGEEYISQRITSAIISEKKNRILDHTGRLTLNQLAAVIQKADLFIGNDSGPMHLAAVCGINVIGLFGPTSPQRFGPYGKHCIALRMEADCQPCMQEECKKPGYSCIQQISVDDVIKVAGKIMIKNSSS